MPDEATQRAFGPLLSEAGVVTLTVWRFDAPDGVDEVLPQLTLLTGNGGSKLDDAAAVTWPRGHRKPTVRSLGDLAGVGVLWGGAWGILLGLIFLVPIAGPAFGAAAGAFAGGLWALGIDDTFVKRVREVVVPGTSALFLLSTTAVADRLLAELGDVGAQVIRSELSPEHEHRLRAVFGEESSARARRDLL
jgi:uncharacterized membrane protein